MFILYVCRYMHLCTFAYVYVRMSVRFYMYCMCCRGVVCVYIYWVHVYKLFSRLLCIELLSSFRSLHALVTSAMCYHPSLSQAVQSRGPNPGSAGSTSLVCLPPPADAQTCLLNTWRAFLTMEVSLLASHVGWPLNCGSQGKQYLPSGTYCTTSGYPRHAVLATAAGGSRSSKFEVCDERNSTWGYRNLADNRSRTSSACWYAIFIIFLKKAMPLANNVGFKRIVYLQ